MMMYSPAKLFAEVPETAVQWRDESLFSDRETSPWRECQVLLRDVGLRPTRKRLLLAWVLFAKGDRHITAEMLHSEAISAKVHVSLATVYNTLNQFTQAGLLRQVGVCGPTAFFDTNPTAHHHFLVEGEDALLDIPQTEGIAVEKVPEPPEGFEVSRVDVVVCLRRISSS
jgi:Fur family iron response transcriptional regulator